MPVQATSAPIIIPVSGNEERGASSLGMFNVKWEAEMLLLTPTAEIGIKVAHGI